MLFYNSKRRELINIQDVYLNRSKISMVNEFKYLGLIIDLNLNWNSHVSFIIKKLSPYVGVFRRISFVCGDNVKKILCLFLLKYYLLFTFNMEWH